MRLHGFTLHNLRPFQYASLDLDAIPGTVIAVHGANWSGKTTALETGFAGAMYRDTPTRGSLKDLATARDSYVESHVGDFVIRQLVDSHTGTGKALVRHAGSGTVLLDSGGARDFDRWAAGHLPPADLFFASVFGAQGSSGFLGLGASERKAVLLRALGIERLEALADRARGRLGEARTVVETLAARLRDERARALPVAEAEHGVTVASGALELAHTASARAQERLDDARRRAAARELAESLRAAHVATAADLERRRGETIDQRDVAAARRDAARALLGNAAAIRAQAANLDLIRTRLAAEEAGLEEKRSACDRERRAVEVAEAATQRAQDARDVAAKAAARAQTTVDRGATAERARDALPALRATLEVKEAAREAARAGVERARSLTIDGQGKRIALLRGGLEVVLDDGEGGDAPLDPARRLPLVRLSARECLEEDDAIAAEQASAPAQLRAAEAVLRRAEQEARDAASAVVRAENEAARIDDLAVARADLEQAIAAQHAAARAIDEHEEAWRAAHDRWTALTLEAGRLDQNAQALRGDRERAEKASQRLPEIARAEEVRRQADEQIEAADRAIADLDGRIAALGPEPSCPRPVDVAAAERGLEGDRRVVYEATRAHARAEQALQAARESAVRAEAIEAELRTAEQLVADWTLIAKGYGRDGVQALEIDAAGPELTALINDLLYDAFGTRFCVEIRTTRAKADGKGDREVCDVIVTEAGEEKEGRFLSGAGKAIVGLAIRRALAVLSCRRLGLSDPVFVEDESDRDLDADNARAFVRMLRRTAEITGGRVLFVSHNPEAIALADARVLVRDGKLEVDGEETASFEKAAALAA